MKRNGYRPSHRNKWLFLVEGKLSSQALLLWEYYIDQMDFDPKHEGYGTFECNIKEISSVFHCSENTVRNWHGELLRKSIVFRHSKRGHFKLLHPERYAQRSSISGGQADRFAKLEKDKPLDYIFQYISDPLQHIVNIVQPVGIKDLTCQSNSHSKALGSSKVDYSSSPLTTAYEENRVNYRVVSKDNVSFTDDDKEYINGMMDALINPEKK